VRVGAFDIAALVDGEGSFATVGQAFPALDAPEEWRLPVNAVLIRGAGTTVLVDTSATMTPSCPLRRGRASSESSPVAARP